MEHLVRFSFVFEFDGKENPQPLKDFYNATQRAQKVIEGIRFRNFFVTSLLPTVDNHYHLNGKMDKALFDFLMVNPQKTTLSEMVFSALVSCCIYGASKAVYCGNENYIVKDFFYEIVSHLCNIDVDVIKNYSISQVQEYIVFMGMPPLMVCYAKKSMYSSLTNKSIYGIIRNR